MIVIALALYFIDDNFFHNGANTPKNPGDRSESKGPGVIIAPLERLSYQIRLLPQYWHAESPGSINLMENQRISCACGKE
jgi:hypothetical protein